eukprot:SAG31_NODE_40513_length_280_cov_0.856354_1_plen_87_part_01
MIRKRTFLSYQRHHMAAQAVRLALIVMTGCWGPVCLYGLMLISVNVQSIADEEAMGTLAKFHAVSSILAPTFGLLLFVVFEVRFKFR